MLSSPAHLVSIYYSDAFDAISRSGHLRRPDPDGSKMKKPLVPQGLFFLPVPNVWLVSVIVPFVTRVKPDITRIEIVGRTHSASLVIRSSLSFCYVCPISISVFSVWMFRPGLAGWWCSRILFDLSSISLDERPHGVTKEKPEDAERNKHKANGHESIDDDCSAPGTLDTR